MIVLTESGHRYCEEEIMPLIQAELTPMMVDGLPRHLRLEDK